MTRAQQLAVSVTCLVAAVTYAGAVTTWAMGLFVLPSVAGAALLAWPLAARRMSGMAIGIGGALVLAWGELANIWTGTANGPAARSTVFAAGSTLIAVVLANSRWPALFLAGVTGVVVGALILGAAGEVRIVVVATGVCAALTLGSIERSRRNWTAPPRRGISLVLLSLLAGAAAVGGVLLQAQADPRHPELLTQGREYPGIKPAWTDPLGTASRPHGSTADRLTNSRPSPPNSHAPRGTSTPKPRHATRSHRPPTSQNFSRSRTWLYVLAAILLFLLAVAIVATARLLSTQLAWRRLQRRLADGSPADQVTGAWAWTRMRLDACRLPLGLDVSPDGLAVGGTGDDLPGDVYAALRELAAVTTTAAFAHEQRIGRGGAAAAWRVAARAEASAREHLTRRGRARLAFRRPRTQVHS